MENGNELVGKTILLVNTGSQKKKFIVQKLKKMGLYVIVLNKEKNWATPYVDEWILADTYNHSESIKAVDAYIKNNQNKKIDGVLTFWEDDVLLTAKITDRFNFIGIPYNIAKQVRNKYLFREFCERNGIKAPKHKLVKSTEDLESVAGSFNYPLVIKPAFGSSSAYVVKVENRDDLFQTFNYIKKSISADTESSLSDGLDVFVEEFLDGDEVDIDIVLQNGKIKFYTISDNFNKGMDQFFVDKGQSIPSTLPEHCQAALIDLAEETLEKLGIQNGNIHYEAKWTTRGAYPIEVNLRMGGDYVYSYNKAAWDLDLVENAVKIAVGQYIKIKRPDRPKKYIIGWDLHPESSGLLVELNIIDDLRRKKYFEEMHLYKDVGEPILLPPEGYESLGWLTVSGENFLDAQDNLRDALNYIKFKVVKFDHQSSFGKTSRKNRLSAAVLNKKALIKAARLEKVKRITVETKHNLHVGIAAETLGAPLTPDQYSGDEMQQFGELLKTRGYKISYFDFNDPIKTFNDLRQSEVDIVFNLCGMVHKSNLYEPHVAAMLEILQIPFTGADYSTLSLCLDKIKMKKILEYHEIPVPKWDYATVVDEEIDDELRYPLIVKPANQDGSVGITAKSVVSNNEELRQRVGEIIETFGCAALIEEFIDGDEYDVCVLGNTDNDLRVLPLSRYIFNKMPDGYFPFFPHETKWTEDHPIYNYNNIVVQRPPKNISKNLESLMTEIALDTYRILGCKDYGRIEFRVNKDGNPFVIELNPNPAIDSDSNFVSAAKIINMDYADLLEEIIWLAIKRYKSKFSFK